MKPSYSIKGVPVLDVAGHGGRSVAETVRGAGLASLERQSLEAWQACLLEEQSLVGIIAFEALWPDPQSTLRALRGRIGGARIIVVYTEGSPRLRLGQRLWGVGLCDSFIPRSTSPLEMGPLLRQAYAEAFIDRATQETRAEAAPEVAQLHEVLRFLQNMSAAFTSQRKVEGLLRELQIKLPQFLDYHVMEVLLVEKEGHKLFVFQTSPIDHQIIWKLAEECCLKCAPLSERELSPHGLTFIESMPTSSEKTVSGIGTFGHDSILVLPLVICGALVGCLSLVLTAPLDSEKRVGLQLISYQLATSLRNAQALEAAETDSLVDELTGAYNRRYLRRLIEAEWRRTTRYALDLTAVMVDLDHFKGFNDQYGHLIGDEVLRSVSGLFRQHLRDTDHLVRYGGEEFLILLPETTTSEASLVLERMRLLFARQPVYTDEKHGNLRITFSAGIASYPGCNAATAEELIGSADEALLNAKRSGRDRVCISSDSGFQNIAQAPVGAEKRRFPRVDSHLQVRFIELPDLESRMVTMSSSDLSTGGIALRGPKSHLKKNAYALVYLEAEQKAVLSQVRWTRDDGDDQRSAGLEFLRTVDVDGRQRKPPIAENRKALVISQRPQTQALVKRVLHAAQYQITFLAPDQRLTSEALEDCSLLLVGESVFRGELGLQLQQIRQRPDLAFRIIVIDELNDRRSALETIHHQQVEHLVSGAGDSEEVLFATLSKLLLGRYFGIDKYLLWGSETKGWVITKSTEKDEVLRGIKEMAEGVHCHPRIIDLLVSAVDEMIINALFRPIAAGGAEGKPVSIECGSDGRLLAVAVLDEHGLFRQESLYSGIGKALEQEENGLPPELEHASLGFRIMLGALSQLAINVDPGRCTEIIGIVDLRKSLRDYRSLVPNLGMFTKDPES